MAIIAKPHRPEQPAIKQPEPEQPDPRIDENEDKQEDE
jgi:hypothetical protein